MTDPVEEFEKYKHKEQSLEQELVQVKRKLTVLALECDIENRKRARAASDERLTGFEALPAEILCIIARHCSFEEVERLRRVSRALHEKISHDTVWKPVYGAVPEQKLPMFKYHVAARLLRIRPRARIHQHDIFGKFRAKGDFYEMLRIIRPHVPDYLHNFLYGADFENIGGVLFLRVKNPRSKNFYKDLKRLLRIGVIAIPKNWFIFYSEKIIFVAKSHARAYSVEGFLFTIATSDFRPFTIHKLQNAEDNYFSDVQHVGEVVEFYQYSHTDTHGKLIFNKYSLDVSKDFGICKLIKTGC